MKLISKVNNNLVLEKSALDVISKIEGEVAVIVIVGPYRSGKSFILSSIINVFNGAVRKEKPFKVGHKDEAFTKDVWISDDVLKVKDKLGQDLNVILIDTEVTYSTIFTDLPLKTTLENIFQD